MAQKVQEKVLAFLQAHSGEYYSGEALASGLGVTRAAVWKAVQSLKAQGVEFDAVPNRGYRILGMGDALRDTEIQNLLTGNAAALRVETFGTVTSTNALVRERAAAGEREGLVVVADSQTAGRGRLGRSFFSPPGTGVYISLLLRPSLSPQSAGLITTCAAVAVSEALEQVTGEKAEIKWVNDIFVRQKKVCGILTEGAVGLEAGVLDYAVLGLGVNLCAPPEGFPQELSEIAGAVCPAHSDNLRNRFVAVFLNLFFGYYPLLEEKAFVPAYRKRCFVIGKSITVLSSGSSEEARALDVDDECRLLVQFADGRKAALSSGEISIRLN